MQFIFIDTETTGLDPLNNSLVEIAAILTDSSLEILDSINFKVPLVGVFIDPEVKKFHGKSDAPLEHPHYFAEKLRNMIESALWCGSNPRFDYAFLEQMYKELLWRMPKPSSHHLIDVPSMFADLLGSEIPNLKQSTLTEYLGLGEQPHNAYGDALQLIDLMKKKREAKI